MADKSSKVSVAPGMWDGPVEEEKVVCASEYNISELRANQHR